MERVEHLLSASSPPAPRRAGIDALYDAFASSLPPRLEDEARGLACTLGLAPSRAVPWSEVFGHEVTLGAPGLVAEAMPALPPRAVEGAALAHLLAVIEAFGTDRIEDGQVEATAALRELLAAVRRERDAALVRAGDDGSGGGAFAEAERETLRAIAAEVSDFKAGARVSFARYLAVSYGKQRVGLPASLSLGRAAGWEARRLAALRGALDGVWLGLQLHDDVVDWPDDFARAGAWAALLAGVPRPLEGGPPSPEDRRAVYDSGVLARMLRTSAQYFGASRRRASVLGAHRLASWAAAREEQVRALSEREAESPGFTARAQALSGWAREVLG